MPPAPLPHTLLRVDTDAGALAERGVLVGFDVGDSTAFPAPGHLACGCRQKRKIAA